MGKTIDQIKNKRQVSEQVKNKVKEFNRIKKAILNALKANAKSIPEIASETGYPLETITYTLMTLQKYNDVEVDKIDEMDEFFFYKISKED